MVRLDILFISDYVCPYCLVEKEVLLRTLKKTGIKAKITWQPFELTMEPKPRVDTYHDEVRKAHYQVLVEPCKALELPMKLPPAVVPRPYSRLAFEGYFYAKAHKKGDDYNTAVYNAYFLDEKDIGQIDVLADLAEGLGLDRADFVKCLEDGVYTEEEHASVMYAREVLKPTGVPTIYVDGIKITINDYTMEELEAILLPMYEKKRLLDSMERLTVVGDDKSYKLRENLLVEEEAVSEENGGFSGCGPDGC